MRYRSGMKALGMIAIATVGLLFSCGAKKNGDEVERPDSSIPAGPSTEVPTGSDAGFDGASPLPSSGTRDVPACSTLGTGTDICRFELRLDPTRCAKRGCRKLAIFFAGGQQTCTESILQAYAERGYVATCALLFESSTGTSLYPYND